MYIFASQLKLVVHFGHCHIADFLLLTKELCPGGTLLSHLETAMQSRARKDVPCPGTSKDFSMRSGSDHWCNSDLLRSILFVFAYFP